MVTNQIKNKFYFSGGKRVFDLALTIPAVIILLPLFAVIAGLIIIKLGKPVLFRQTRPGMNEETFAILKFRTMTNARDKDGKLLPDAQRLTAFGAFLRKTSVDELPELINVLKGDMSLVGPRPLLTMYLPYYTDRERTRHTVRPGITGLAQVSGRNYLQWDERLEMDAVYVEKMSLWLDVKIMFQTLLQVLRTKDVAVLPGTVSTYLSHYRESQKEKANRQSQTDKNGSS